MGRITILAFIPFVVCCTKQEQVDCTRLNLPAIEQCAQANQAKGDLAVLTSCLPFSQPLKTSGTWVVGFEKNEFFEGPRPPPADVLWTESTGAELLVEEKTFEPQNHIEALQVEVVGRRALCAIGGLNAYPIVVEKLRISKRIVK